MIKDLQNHAAAFGPVCPSESLIQQADACMSEGKLNEAIAYLIQGTWRVSLEYSCAR